jgi:hypothetical protein
MAVHVPVRLSYDADVDGVYESVIPASHIHQADAQYGFKGVRAYVSDAARARIEVVNAGGAYTAAAGLRAGVWARIEDDTTGAVLYTGRIEEVAVSYARAQPYATVHLSTSRGDLTAPTESQLLKNTDVKAAVTALLEKVPLASFGGYWLLGYSALNISTKLYDSGSGSALSGVEAWTEFHGTGWKAISAAGGYGVRGGELDVLRALQELMKAEDGRAVWSRANVLDVYSQGWLDAARAGIPAHTLTDAVVRSAAIERGSLYANDVQVVWFPKRWAAGTVLWTLEPETAISLAPGAHKDWNVRFKTEGERVVAAEAVVVTATSTDTLYQEWAGGLAATGGTLRLTNYTGSGIDLTGISIAGTALLASDEATERRRNEYDISRFGLRSYRLDCSQLDNQALAGVRADRELAQANVNAAYAARVELRPRTSADARQWMGLPFGTLIRLDSDRMSHDATYLVIGVDWSMTEGATLADVTLYLEPVP